MLWRLLADLVLVIHALFILYAVVGGLACFWHRRLVWVHLPVVTWAALVVLFAWPCPLTPLEIHLREQAGQTAFQGSFVEHYLLHFIYPEGLTRGIQIGLGLGVLGINMLIYGLLLKKKRKFR
jgi:hypothetical protein